MLRPAAGSARGPAGPRRGAGELGTGDLDHRAWALAVRVEPDGALAKLLGPRCRVVAEPQLVTGGDLQPPAPVLQSAAAAGRQRRAGARVLYTEPPRGDEPLLVQQWVQKGVGRVGRTVVGPAGVVAGHGGHRHADLLIAQRAVQRGEVAGRLLGDRPELEAGERAGLQYGVYDDHQPSVADTCPGGRRISAPLDRHREGCPGVPADDVGMSHGECPAAGAVSPVGDHAVRTAVLGGQGAQVQILSSPHTIVGGNPARPICQRFADDGIERPLPAASQMSPVPSSVRAAFRNGSASRRGRPRPAPHQAHRCRSRPPDGSRTRKRCGVLHARATSSMAFCRSHISWVSSGEPWKYSFSW